MSTSIRFCLVLHNHQPIGNFDDVFEAAYRESYLPFLNVFESYAALSVSLHTSGPLMEWLERHHPEYLERLRALVGFPSREWTKTFLSNTGITLNIENVILKPNFIWRRHHDKFMLDKTNQRSAYLNHHTTDMFTPQVYIQKELPLLGRFGLGIEYGEEIIDSTNLGDHNRSHKSIFADSSKEFGSSLTLGASVRQDDFDGFNGFTTGSLSARLKLTERGSLYTAVSKTARIPAFTELFYSDPTTIGDENLSAEEAVNYQAGYDYKTDRINSGITVFFRDERDIIDWVKRNSTYFTIAVAVVAVATAGLSWYRYSTRAAKQRAWLELAVRPLLGSGLEERLLASWKPYLEIEGLGDRLAVTRRSWIEPKDVRTMLDQAAWILDDLRRASPR